MTQDPGRHDPRDRLARTPEADLVRGLPGLLRVGANAWWKATTWAVGSSVQVTTEIVRRSVNGEPPARILSDVTRDLRSAVTGLLGLDGEGSRMPGTPDPPSARGTAAWVKPLPGKENSGSERSGGKPLATKQLAVTQEDLRRQGANLLRQSADVRIVEEGHPAYARILAELTPDEARILRFLCAEGPQPSIDIRTNRPFGIGSELVEGGLNMIAERAGCRNVERVHPYLTNLYRLGLLEFSKEQVADPNRYQLVEAQPKVLDVLDRAGRAPKIVHRSIHLNPFGKGFCATCLAPPGFPASNGDGPRPA